MLNFHVLLPDHTKQHTGQFIHYLSLGAHQSPYEFKNVGAFSVVTILDKQRLPQIELDKNKWSSMLIMVNGALRVDGENVEKGKQIVMDPVNISNEGESVATFVYIVLKADEKAKERVSVNATKDPQSIEQSKSLIYMLQGHLTVGEAPNELLIKQKQQNISSLPLVYSVSGNKLKLSENSVYIRVDNVE